MSTKEMEEKLCRILKNDWNSIPPYELGLKVLDLITNYNKYVNERRRLRGLLLELNITGELQVSYNLKRENITEATELENLIYEIIDNQEPL